MRAVAFFRNVNQGQRGHPATTDLLDSLAEAGFADAVAFQSNGTVVFTDAGPAGPADANAGPANSAEAIATALAAISGSEREVFIMPLSQLVDLVAVHAPEPDAARRELTLHGGAVIDLDDPAVIAEAGRRRCRLLASGPGWAVSVNERERESHATPVLERLTDGPATSRGLPTLVRLIDRFAT